MFGLEAISLGYADSTRNNDQLASVHRTFPHHGIAGHDWSQLESCAQRYHLQGDTHRYDDATHNLHCIQVLQTDDAVSGLLVKNIAD